MTKEDQERNVITEMIQYLENNEYDSNNPEFKKKLREWISAIVKLEAKELGYETQVMVDDENTITNYNKLSEAEDTGKLFLFFLENTGSHSFDIYINSDFPTPRAPRIQFSEDDFLINLEKYKTEPINACTYIMYQVWHELRHMVQYLMATNTTSSYISLMWAKTALIIGKYNKFYQKNHDSMLIEEDANISALRNWFELTNTPYSITTSPTAFHKCGLTTIGRDDFASNFADKLLKKKNNIGFLKQFPILQKEYNENGKPKSAMQLLENMQSELEEILSTNDLSDSEKDILITDCKSMYFELLYRAMKKTTFEEIIPLTEVYNKDDKTALFSDMKLYFKEKLTQESLNILDYITFSGGIDAEEKELLAREKYYQSKIDFLDMLQYRQQNNSFLAAIINKGKKFVRTGKINSLNKTLVIVLDNEQSEQENTNFEQEEIDESK